MNKLTFANNNSTALRVEVSGVTPREIDTLLLTGSGDEHDLDLSPGRYTADVTDISTGNKHSFKFTVEEGVTDRVIKVGLETTSKSGTWRASKSTPKTPVAPAGSWMMSPRATIAADSSEAASGPRLRMDTKRGWRSFRGTTLVNRDKPDCLKIVRPGTWNENPTVRLDFTTKTAQAFHCFVPLFSGGTILSWNKDVGSLHDMMPSDAKSAAIVGGLSRSLKNEVPDILRWISGGSEDEALKIISQSRDDPWIGVAAGLLLVGSGRAKQTGPSTLRLASRHPWMADFGVLAAWWSAASEPSNEEGCLKMMVGARELGHIYFWDSFVYAEQLLTALGSGSKSVKLRSDARKEVGRWKRLRSGSTKAGAFVVWGNSAEEDDDILPSVG